MCVGLGLYSGAAQAQSDTDRAASDTLGTLARHPQWLRLLHAAPDGRSEIHSPEFFLAADGATDPEAELRATLQALRGPQDAQAAMPARCRFPARAFWLEQQGVLPAGEPPHAACPRLARWAGAGQLRSISLLLVSGYFANPASSFGHALLRFNTENGRASGGLIDLGVNFGALVPENEPIAVYIAKGLFGGYEAGFSDKFYYTHDLVYSRTEFRDMWDYELDLSEAERWMLVYHLWEIAGKKFTYYFLKENCAYRMAELLAVARNDALLARSSFWFAPVELFHRLRAASPRDGRGWFRSVRFVPSAERVLRHELATLADQARVARSLMEHGATDPRPSLQGLSEAQQIGVLDALLAFHEYRMAAEEPHVSAATRQAQDAVLRARLLLPASPDARTPVPQRPSPVEGTTPLLAAIGVGHEQDAGTFTRLHWAPFSYELSGYGGLDDGELVVLDTVLDIRRSGSAELERLDVIRVKKLQAAQTPLPGESSLSWQLRLGAQRELVAGVSRLRPGAGFGMGLSARWSEGLVAYAMVDALALGNPAALGTEPQLGLVLHDGPWKLWLKAGSRWDSAARHWTPRHEAHLSRRLSADWVGRLEWARAPVPRAALSLLRYW